MELSTIIKHIIVYPVSIKLVNRTSRKKQLKCRLDSEVLDVITINGLLKSVTDNNTSCKQPTEGKVEVQLIGFSEAEIPYKLEFVMYFHSVKCI